jgi:MFS family permease
MTSLTTRADELDARPTDTRTAEAPPTDVRPAVTLGLLSVQHALIHAQSALMPLIFIQIIDQFRIGVGEIGLLIAAGNILSGVIQLSFGWLTRVVSRRGILGIGGLVFGAGMSALALTTAWIPFAVTNVVARVGGAPQHPVGNALIAEQYQAARRGTAISVHIAVGNLGTVAIPLVGGWVIARSGWPPAVAMLAIPALVVAVAILLFVREAGTDRAAARHRGSALSAYRSLRHERDLLWLFAGSSVAAAGRGLGIITTFVPLYLSRALGLDDATVALMYTLLLIGSVPAPIVAGWISDRVGHKRVLIATYLAGAASLAVFVVVGSNIPAVWLAIGFLSAFVFEESSLMQALLADIARPAIRDVAFSAYFTFMFGVGALWAAFLGALVGTLGDAEGFPIAFGIMAASYLGAALVVTRIRPPDRRGRPAEAS